MKILISTALAGFLISAAVTMFLTGTFKQLTQQSRLAEYEEGGTSMGKLPDAKAGETSAAITEDAETERAAGSPPHTQEPEPQDSENDTASETELQAKLAEYEAQITAEETKLAAIKAEISSLSAVKASVTRSQHLAKIYSSMQPDSAASILCKLEEAVSMQILTQMDNRTSGKIMDAIADTDPRYAAKISKLMVENQEFVVSP